MERQSPLNLILCSAAWGKLGGAVLFVWMWLYCCITLGADLFIGFLGAAALTLLLVWPFGIAWGLLGIALGLLGNVLFWLIKRRPRSPA